MVTDGGGCRSIRRSRRGRLCWSGLLALPVGLAFDDEFVGGRLQSVHRGLGQQWVGHHGQDFRGLAVAGDDGGGGAVAFDDELVEVAGLGGLQSVQREVVDDEQLDAVQFAHLVFVGAVQPCPAQAFEQFVGAFGVHAVVAADGDVS